MDINSTPREIELPKTSGLLYEEYCKPFYMQTKLDSANTFTAPPLFLTYKNVNSATITEDWKGFTIKIASNLISSGSKYILQRYLMMATN
jgi:hypothetical protein